MTVQFGKVLDLSQDFSMHTPAFAGYPGPEIKWIKRLAFERAGGQVINTTLHVGTHLDAPAHFLSGGKFIGDFHPDWLVGPACVVDLERMGVGDYELYGPEHFERWESDTGIKIEENDILVIHTGYHRYYPENWLDRSEVDEEKYFLRHPGPTREFAEWLLERKVRWLALDVSSADHPMNTVIRNIRPDEAELAEAEARALARRGLPEGRLPDHAHDPVSATTSSTSRISAARSTRCSTSGSPSAASRGDSRAGRQPSAGPWRSPSDARTLF